MGQADGHGDIDSTVDADQEIIYIMVCATHPSACYAHFFLGKLNRPFCTFLMYRV